MLRPTLPSIPRCSGIRSGQHLGLPRLQPHVRNLTVARAGKGTGDDDDMPQVPQQLSQLEETIKRKQQQVEATLKELGMEALEERLQSSVQVPANPPYRLSTLIAEASTQGRAILCYELARPTPTSTSQDLVKLAKSYVAMGVEALVVLTDSYYTPEGLRDLWSVAQAVKVPVIGRDWLIHPLQIVDIKEAGAAGSLGVIHQVNGRGTAVMSSFAAAIGLDAPVEVVNLREVESLAQTGVVFYAINVSVGLSVSLSSFAQDMAHGILGNLPFGSISMVGVKTVEEARKARLSGADSLLIKHELIAEHISNPKQLFDQLQYVTCGDD